MAEKMTLNGEMLQAGADAMEKYVNWERTDDTERYACVEAIWRAMHLAQPAQAVDVDGLCHELWAMAQGTQPVADAVKAMRETITRAIGNSHNNQQEN